MTDEAEANRHRVRLAYAALARGDEEGFYSTFSPDVVMHEAESLPYGGVYQGIEGLKRGVANMFAAWREMKYSVEEITAGGDLVFVYLHVRGTAPDTGESLVFPVAELWRFRNGQAIEFRPIYWDTHRALEVLRGKSD